MNTRVGHVWGEDWNGFRLSVIGTQDGFRAIVVDPWEDHGQMCKTVYATDDEAVLRCWGMVRQSCEVKAAQAAERISNNSTNPSAPKPCAVCCPKCGSGDVLLRYIGLQSVYVGGSLLRLLPEKIRNKCQRCDYGWDSKPKRSLNDT